MDTENELEGLSLQKLFCNGCAASASTLVPLLH
jgi:hypothetical protein